MNNNYNTGLHGTKTEKNLYDAAKNESLAFTKYTIYSDIAKKEGYPGIAEMYKHLANNEKEHAELWLGYLGEFGNTEENLEKSAAAEKFEADEYYPHLAKNANDEGFSEISDKFRMVSTVEKNHSTKTLDSLDSITLDTMYSGKEDSMWECTNCGYTINGSTPPDYCPLCGYPKNYFKKIH